MQRATLNLYGELVCRRADWRGQLVFAAFEGSSETGLSAAASLTGAASLVVDADMAAVHASNRDGAFDFVVNSLDEAIRALKNEVRRGRPLAVALMAKPLAVVEEAAERGLAPDVVLSGAGQMVRDALLGAEGAVHLGGLGQSAELGEWLRERGWLEYPVASIRPGQLGYVDGLGEDDVIRRSWLRDLPKYQRSVRQGGRWCWLTSEEIRATGAPSEA